MKLYYIYSHICRKRLTGLGKKLQLRTIYKYAPVESRAKNTVACCSHSLRPLTEGHDIRHSVHFADQHFHLICSEATEVQDANDMRVLQLAGTRQHLVCENAGFVLKHHLSRWPNMKLCYLWCQAQPLGLLPGSGRVSPLGLAGSPRGQKKPDERLESIVLPWGSSGRPTALGSAVLTMGKYAASTAICLFIPADNKSERGFTGELLGLYDFW